MSKEIDNIFVDVRNAFRLLNNYQERVINIVSYIREQTPFTDMWGSKWFSNEIRKRNDSPDTDYAKLRIYKDMWGWDFLYGYFLEYYFGQERIDKKNVEMSIFQISDDGYFISNQERRQKNNTSSFEASELSHSYLILNVAIYTTKYTELWLKDLSNPNDEYVDFLMKFLSSSSEKIITKNKKGEVAIVKKYVMQRFATQDGADTVIRDFGNIVKEQTGVKLFKGSFY